MNFNEYELKLLDTKPRFLNDEEKGIRNKCIYKIQNYKRKDKNKEYYEKNKEKNKEKKKERNKKYRFENKEKIREQDKKYRKSPAGYKTKKKQDWKKIGVIDNDFDKLFELYMNTTNCENCNVLLTRDRQNTSTTKCLDHCHLTGKFRNILCNACNVRRG